MAQNTPVIAGFQLLSPAFKEGQAIPKKYTCKDQNINPPLNIVGPPVDAKSFALIMHDPDAIGGDFVHWTMWNLDRSTEAIEEGHPPVNAIEGANGTDKSGYIGPCPPTGSGTHHYIFELYALNSNPGISAGTSVKDFKNALQGRIVADTKLTGLYAADQ